MIRSKTLRLILLFTAPALFAASYPFSNPVLGKTPAPFTLEYFSSYDCQYCDEFEATVLPSLTDDIEAGRLRVVFRDLPGDTPRIRKLAQRVFCSQHDSGYLLFRGQLKDQLRGISKGPSSAAGPALDDVSAKLHQSCMTESGFGSVLHHNQSTFEKYGFHGTPAFVLTRTIDDGFDQMTWSGQTNIRYIIRLLAPPE